MTLDPTKPVAAEDIAVVDSIAPALRRRRVPESLYDESSESDEELDYPSGDEFRSSATLNRDPENHKFERRPSVYDKPIDLCKLEKYLQLTPDKVNDYVDLIVGEYDGNKITKRAQEAALMRKVFNVNAKFTFYSQNTKLVQGDALSMLGNGMISNMGDDFFWLDVCNPSEADLRILSSIFGLHPLTTEDIAMNEAREKAELYDSYLFTCFKSFVQDYNSESYLSEIFLYIVTFPTCLLSIHYTPIPHTLNVLLRLHTAPVSSVTLTSDWITYALLDDVMDAFIAVVKSMEYDVDCIDDLVLILHESEQSDMLRRIRIASKKVTQLLRLLHFKGEVIKSLANRNRFGKFMKPETVLYLRDIKDHVLTLHYTLDMTYSKLHNAHTIYLSQVSVELAQYGNTTNKIMKKLSGFAGIFLPITFITSLFGMNVRVPGQPGEEDGPLTWFLGLLGGMLVFSLVFYLIAKRKDIM